MYLTELVMEAAYPASLLRFYGEHLGLDAVMQDGVCRITTPGTVFIFEPAATGAAPFYHFAFNIPANGLQGAKSWIEQKVELLWIAADEGVVADFVNWRAQSLYFFDPAGNIVELIARFDLPNATAETFGPQHLLSVSEVGLVFPDEKGLEAGVAALRQQGLPYFSKQPPFPQFKALGDDEGLFIAVPQHRHWYPTQKQAGIFPLRVQWQHEGQKHQWQL